jgi:phosphate transport system protein
MTTSNLPAHLLGLRRSILALWALVKSRTERAVAALVDTDLDSAREIRHGDHEVDVMEVDIERHCIEVLALQQPVARDLRFILAVLRMNNELERIGDLSKGIAKRLLHLEKLGAVQLPPEIGEMAKVVQTMLDDSLQAFTDGDVDVAQAVRRRDDEVDVYQRRIIEWAQEALLDASASSEPSIEIMGIANNLERIGDICTNIAEDVVYLVEGEVVRHTAV